MELTDLDQDERLALVALVEATVQADHAAGSDDGEEEMLAEMIDTLGADTYRKAADLADQRFTSDDDLKVFLKGIERQEARELIYGTVLELGISEVVTGHESPLLSWVAAAWQVHATVEPLEPDIR